MRRYLAPPKKKLGSPRRFSSSGMPLAEGRDDKDDESDRSRLFVVERSDDVVLAGKCRRWWSRRTLVPAVLFMVVMAVVASLLGATMNIEKAAARRFSFGQNAVQLSASNGNNTRRRRLYIEYQMEAGARTSIGERQLTPWTCDGSPNNDERRMPLPEVMRPFFNTTTSIRTDSKILVMGDSVGIQMSTYLQDLLRSEYSNLPPPKIMKMPLGMGNSKAPSIHVTAPLNNEGAGAIAGWRLTGLLQRQAFNWAPANYNRGWEGKDVQTLRDHVSDATSGTLNETKQIQNITGLGEKKDKQYLSIEHKASGDFDILIFRIPSPSWIGLHEVTRDTLRETVELANELFGVRIVVFISLDHNNNVLTNEMREARQIKNDLLFDFARNWTRGSSNDDEGAVHTVFVLDYARLSGGLMEWNARLLGFDTKGPTYMDAKLRGINNKRGKEMEHHRLSIAHVCSENVPDDSEDCTRNAITVDGMHMCINIIGSRLVAVLFCQLQCASGDKEYSWTCAEACNERFMNVNHALP